MIYVLKGPDGRLYERTADYNRSGAWANAYALHLIRPVVSWQPNWTRRAARLGYRVVPCKLVEVE